jgi:hypothetical protein
LFGCLHVLSASSHLVCRPLSTICLSCSLLFSIVVYGAFPKASKKEGQKASVSTQKNGKGKGGGKKQQHQQCPELHFLPLLFFFLGFDEFPSFSAT